MSEMSWVLRGVDPAVSERAAEEACRRGVSVADYLTEILQQNAYAAELLATPHAAPDLAGANFAVRHRLDSIERRLKHAVGGLDGAVHDLDRSLSGLAARVDDDETLAADTAKTVHGGHLEMSGNLAALRKRLADSEDDFGALCESNSAAHAELADTAAGLEQRLHAVERVARGANSSASAASDALAALERAVAEDFSALARQTAARFDAEFSASRADADAAAKQTDAALAHQLQELRALRDTLEARLTESAAETRGHMQAAFADAARRHTALAERVSESELAQARTAEYVSRQIESAIDAARRQMEENSRQLRQAQAALNAKFVHESLERRTSLQAARDDFAGGIADLDERQLSAQARLEQLQASVGIGANEVTALRDMLESRLEWVSAEARAYVTKAQTAWAERADTLARDAAANTERVEACTLAALEKLNHDRAGGDAALQQKLDTMADAARVAAECVRQRLDHETAALRGRQAAALARLDYIDAAIPALEQGLARVGAAQNAERPIERSLAQRLAQLEIAAGISTAEAEHMRRHLDQVSAQIAEPRLDAALGAVVDDLRARVDAQESAGLATAQRAYDLARSLGLLASESVDTAAQLGERQHSLELTLVELGQRASAAEAGGETVAGIGQRVDTLDRRQTDAFETLRADIATFVGENNQRLELLERDGDAAGLTARTETRLAELEQCDLAGQFAALRQRIEERMLGVEQRSVRMLEQVVESIALVERRFSQGDEPAATQSA